MTKRILENGLNVKDDTRLANASSKLSSNQLGDSFSFNTEVNPVMIAGVEENVNLSTLDLISCIRDQNGVNRLCTDIRGIATLTKEQTNVSDCIPFAGISIQQPIADTMNLPLADPTALPANKILFVTQLIVSNGGASAIEIQFLQDNGMIFDIFIGVNNTIVLNDLMIPLYPGNVITAGSASGNFTGSVSYQGVMQ